MAPLPTLKLRVLPTFPASVTGAAPVTLAKAAGAYTIGFSQDVAMTWTQPHVFNPTNGDGITITPKPASTNKSIVSTQSTPVGGTVAGPFALNLWNITYSTRITGSGIDATGNNNVGAVGFRVNQNITTAGVASTSAPIITGLFTATVNTTTAITDVTGLAGTAFTNVAMSGAYLEGLNGVATVGATGSANILVGLDTGATILTGGTANYRLGISVLTAGGVNGATLDAAIAFNSNTTTKFNKVFAFSNFSGTAPIGTSTDIFFADTAYSVANFANLGNMSVSGSILKFDKMALSGDGRMVLGGNSNTLAAFPAVLQAKQASGGSATIQSGTNTATGSSGFDVLNSTSAAEAFLQVNEPARTAVRFGQTSGNWSEIGSFGGNGLLFGTEDNTPLIIGTNNAARMRVTGAGLVNIGTDVAPTVPFTINKNAVALPAPSATGTIFQFGGADTAPTRVYHESFGSFGTYTFRRSDGTGALPTALQSNDLIGGFQFEGATGAGTWNTVDAAIIAARASQPWTPTANGTDIFIYTIPNGATTGAEVLRFLNGGNVKFTNAANFSANNARTVTIGNVGPAAINATIAKWLTFQDSAGTVSYMPVWQ